LQSRGLNIQLPSDEAKEMEMGKFTTKLIVTQFQQHSNPYTYISTTQSFNKYVK
jgi:hypothetical protein